MTDSITHFWSRKLTRWASCKSQHVKSMKTCVFLHLFVSTIKSNSLTSHCLSLFQPLYKKKLSKLVFPFHYIIFNTPAFPPSTEKPSRNMKEKKKNWRKFLSLVDTLHWSDTQKLKWRIMARGDGEGKRKRHRRRKKMLNYQTDIKYWRWNNKLLDKHKTCQWHELLHRIFTWTFNVCNRDMLFYKIAIYVAFWRGE